ncbi:Protein LURP-one-related 6 [Mucuna pruriens]|uniref:Protein LURP-one-related 6 n=1 Tax=Mucuna pruriens TaxID=157652 RepID=A0A371IC62_MUCPR|nr:Protein LURP-one-related 6 [Mucuna pruriens]
MIAKTKMMPIIGKLYCSSSPTMLVVRRRPHVVNGGGFVVMDCSAQRVLFRVHGCGLRGKKGELILSEADGDALLLMCPKGSMVEALSIYKKWKGYSLDYKGSRKVVFSLKEPNSCLVKNNAIRISTRNRGWDFKIRGYFPDKCCSIVDSKGDEVAQVGMMKEVEELMESKDLYHVVVKPGMDQAFDCSFSYHRDSYFMT